MDALIQQVYEKVIIHGGSLGFGEEEFWNVTGEMFRVLFGMELQQGARPFIWEQINSTNWFQVQNDDQNTLKISVTSEGRLKFYCSRRALKINDTQLQVLDIIASSYKKGITQSEVGKRLGMDARSFFHQLKSLVEFGLVSRLPVSHQKTFTYLLHLNTYAPTESVDDIIVEDESDVSETVQAPSTAVVRNRIMEILFTAPQKTLPSGEVYRLLGGSRHVRLYRRNVTWLIVHGFIECFIAEELGGVVGRILKWKKALTAADNTKRSIQVKKSVSEVVTLVELGSGFNANISIERQIQDYIDEQGKVGATLSDIMQEFGLVRKMAYRVGERLTIGKQFKDSQVVKVTEFLGKERRHRFFTHQGQQRDNTTNITAAATTCNTATTTTRLRRIQVIMEMLNESLVIECGRSLIMEIQRRLNEQEYLMDTKTLRRIITQMQEEALVKSIVIILPNRVQKTIITKADIAMDDERVISFIDNLKRTRLELHSNVTDLTGDDAVGNGDEVSKNKVEEREHKFKLQKHGFVYGILERAKILHHFIINTIIKDPSNSEWICETLPTFFRNLPLGIFLQVIGIGEMSRDLAQFLNNSPSALETPLSHLPTGIREEIHRRRVDRHKSVVKALMDLLSQLGLAKADNRYPSVAFRLPYQYRLFPTASILDLHSKSTFESVDLVTDFNKYWNWLASLPDLTDDLQQLPPVYMLARRRESWQTISPFSRSFKKTLRKLLDRRNRDDFDFDEQVNRIVNDFEVDREAVLRELNIMEEEFRMKRQKRSEERRRAKRTCHTDGFIEIQPRPVESDSSSESDELNVIKGQKYRKALLHTLSGEELSLLRVAIVMLHQPLFRMTNGTLQWTLIESLYKEQLITAPIRSSEDLRIMFQRLAVSPEHAAAFRKVESRISILNAAVKVGIIESYVDPSFSSVFKYYLNHLSKWEDVRGKIRQHNAQCAFPPISYQKDVKSNFEVEENWRRMTRVKQAKVFLTKSYALPSMHPVSSEDESWEWVLVKKILAIPVAEYDSGSAHKILSSIPSGRLEQVVTAMLQSGLLMKGDSAKYQARIPNSPYNICEAFHTLLTGVNEFPVSSQIKDGHFEVSSIGSQLKTLLKSVAVGRTILALEMVRGLPKVTRSTDPEPDKLIRQILPTTQYQSIWYDLSNNPRMGVFYAACQMIYTEIIGNPGITLQKLYSNLIPILSGVEIEEVLSNLVHCGFVESDAIGYFCCSE